MRTTTLRRATVVAAVTVAMAGCATLDESECADVDWYTLGLEDGNNGHTDDRLDSHTKSCAEFGIQPNVAEWQKGHREGINLYCIPAKGLEEGKNGKVYRNVCPEATRSAFLKAYRLGQDQYQVEQKMDDLRRERSQLERAARQSENQGSTQSYAARIRAIDNELQRLNGDLQQLRSRERYVF